MAEKSAAEPNCQMFYKEELNRRHYLEKIVVKRFGLFGKLGHKTPMPSKEFSFCHGADFF
jgi:hypothetical protein